MKEIWNGPWLNSLNKCFNSLCSYFWIHSCLWSTPAELCLELVPLYFTARIGLKQKLVIVSLGFRRSCLTWAGLVAVYLLRHIRAGQKWRELPGYLPASSIPSNQQVHITSIYQTSRPWTRTKEALSGKAPPSNPQLSKEHTSLPMRYRRWFNATFYPNQKPDFNQVPAGSKQGIFNYFKQFDQTLQLSPQ